MEETIQKLPPSKRFKFLHHQQPHHLPTCLPAKKRIWAPLPLSPLEPQLDKTPTKSNNQEQDDDSDDGIICAVCRSTDGDPSNPIVFCDGTGCDLTVHASCYGNPLTQSIPDGDWFCLKCSEKERDNNAGGFCCCLCLKPGGAVKPTTDGGWAHIVCALFVPEVFFRDPEGREGIDRSEVPMLRRDAECYLCGCKTGCGIGCSEPRCELGFHVSCGVEEGLCVEYIEGRRRAGGGVVAGFCGAHTQLWKKQQLTGKFKIVAREKDSKRKTRV